MSIPKKGLVGLVAVVAALAGCVPAPPSTLPSSAPPEPREFTVAVTEPLTAVDPVAVTDAMSTTFVDAVYQRLLTADPGEPQLKPDAAADCVFETPTVYTCTLREKLVFSNQNPLTSSDVKFSITRALRLGVPGSSARQLLALDRIETPDDLTVRFVLAWADSQFGFALASPAASIVDEESYNPDVITTDLTTLVGSGPMWVSAEIDNRLFFRKNFDYRGSRGAGARVIVLQTFPDSAAVEDAMNAGKVDVVWRGLNNAAVRRLDSQIAASDNETTTSGFTKQVLPGARVHLLAWSSSSPRFLDAELRTIISSALQEDRTLDSIVPVGIEGHSAAFPLGGIPTLPPRTGERPRLTLSFSSHIVGESQLAADVRDRIEEAAGVSVQLVPDSDADLTLLNYRAWTATPFAWLQPYRANLPPGSAAKGAELEQLARKSTTPEDRDANLSELQQQAAVDAVVLPISQDDDLVYTAAGVVIHDPGYGPSWQLALWSMEKQ